MQRIVAFVAPVSAGRSRQAGGADTQATASHSEDPGERPSPPQLADSSELKIEALLSDEQARRVLETLLEREQCAEIDALIDDLLQTGLERAGFDACDLYERIVMAVERRLISRVYDECAHVKTKAAARLGINRNTLNKRLRRHGLPNGSPTRASTPDRLKTRQPESNHEKD